MNWYRTRRVNYEDELSLPPAQRNHLPQPVLLVQALNDNVLVPAMSAGMERVIPNLTRAEVKTGHWALWQAPGRVNEIAGGWLGGLALDSGEVGGRGSVKGREGRSVTGRGRERERGVRLPGRDERGT